MNLMHLKYAVEVAETTSMTKAAENLYTAQPNLSRSIRELENTLGITIFKRTSKGIYPTPQGEEFLVYAREILNQVDAVEAMYLNEKKAEQRFSISVPRASYICDAFVKFAQDIKYSSNTEIFYKETNSLRAISNIMNADYNLAILRYQSMYDKYFKEMLEEKALTSELICEFRYKLLVPCESPLALKEKLTLSDLDSYIEIAHSDPFVPSLPLSKVKKGELCENVDNHIFVFERGSQLQLLSSMKNAFMWGSDVPEKLLDAYGLVQLQCCDNKRKYRDILVYKKDYRLSSLDKKFIDELMKIRKSMK